MANQNPSAALAGFGGGLEEFGRNLMAILQGNKELALRQAEQDRLREEANADRALRRQQLDATLAGQQYERARDLAGTLAPNETVPEGVAAFLRAKAPEIAAARLRSIPTLRGTPLAIGGLAGAPQAPTLPAIPFQRGPNETTNWDPSWQQQQELNRQAKVRTAVEALGPKFGPLAEAFGGQIPTTPEQELANRLAVGKQTAEYDLQGRRITGQYGLAEAAARRKAESEMTAKQERAAFTNAWNRAYADASREAIETLKMLDTLQGKTGWAVTHPGEALPARPTGNTITSRAVEIVRGNPALTGINIDSYLPTSVTTQSAPRDPLALNTPKVQTFPSHTTSSHALNTVMDQLRKTRK